MLGFKRFEAAAITISGIELAEKIRKHQFKTGKLSDRPRTAGDLGGYSRRLTASLLGLDGGYTLLQNLRLSQSEKNLRATNPLR
jgi:hypothetical protein